MDLCVSLWLPLREVEPSLMCEERQWLGAELWLERSLHQFPALLVNLLAFRFRGLLLGPEHLSIVEREVLPLFQEHVFVEGLLVVLVVVWLFGAEVSPPLAGL